MGETDDQGEREQRHPRGPRRHRRSRDDAVSTAIPLGTVRAALTLTLLVPAGPVLAAAADDWARGQSVLCMALLPFKQKLADSFGMQPAGSGVIRAEGETDGQR